MAWVGLDKASIQEDGSPQPASQTGLHTQVLQQGTAEVGSPGSPVPHCSAGSGPPARNDRDGISCPQEMGRGWKATSRGPASPRLDMDVKQLHPTSEGSVPCPSSPSPGFQSPGLSADLTRRTVPSSESTDLAAVTESKEKSRLQITPWACNQENATTEQSHLPTCPPLGFAGRFFSRLFAAVAMT